MISKIMMDGRRMYILKEIIVYKSCEVPKSSKKGIIGAIIIIPWFEYKSVLKEASPGRRPDLKFAISDTQLFHVSPGKNKLDNSILWYRIMKTVLIIMIVARSLI